MVGKLWRALWHGDSKTKSCLWSMILLTLLSVLFVIFWIIQGYFVWMLSAILIIIVVIGIYRTTNFDELQQLPKAEMTEEIPEQSMRKMEMPDEEDLTSEEDEYREDYLEQYNDKAMKKIFVQFKVKKEKIPVVIDLCTEFRICQCPAFLWIDHGNAHFLLLEEEPRHVFIPMNELGKIGYKKGVAAAPMRDYESIIKSPMAKLVFGDLLPTYYKEGVNEYTHRKNLYVLSRGMMLTNNCIGAVMKYFGSKFEPQDQFTQSTDFSRYFKELHCAKILWKDNVLDLKGYKERVKDNLQRMTDERLPYREFDRNLEQMLHRQLITEEFATYFRNLRQKMKDK